MFEKRTDLALEVHELRGKDSGVSVSEEKKNGINVTVATVLKGEGEEISGKRAGKYITVDVGKIWRLDSQSFNNAAELIGDELRALMPKMDGCVLVAGLGNEQITPDSLGPRTVKRLLVTRHIRCIDRELFDTAEFGCLAAISPGVLGQTGIETAEIIKSVSLSVKPCCIILIDSLASRRLGRLATTVQISDNGISPGSGVSNRRAELTGELLGAPIVSLGVPMVVDAATLAHDLLEEHYGGSDGDFAKDIEKILSGSGREMFVTPKDNDIIADSVSKLLSSAINYAVHGMSPEETAEFL